MKPAFVNATALPVRRQSTPSKCNVRMSVARDTVNKYFPVYERHKAPEIKIYGEEGVSLAMTFVDAFAEVDKTTEPLLDYSDEDVFVPNKPVPPSPISWPSGDGRGKECGGTDGSYTQPDLKTYGPFPDFFKRSCDG